MPMPLEEIVASRTLGIIETTRTNDHRSTVHHKGDHPGSSKQIGMAPDHIASQAAHCLGGQRAAKVIVVLDDLPEALGLHHLQQIQQVGAHAVQHRHRACLMRPVSKIHA